MHPALEPPPTPRRLPPPFSPRAIRSTAGRPLLPGLVLGLSGALVLVVLGWFGAAYEREPGSGLRPERVLASPLGEAEAARLRERSERLAARADALEARALEGGDAPAVEGLRKDADQHRAWARSLADRASARDAVLATRAARRQLWVYGVALDVLVCACGGVLALSNVLAALRRLRRERGVSRRFSAGVLAAALALAPAAGLAFALGWYDYESEPYLLVAAAVGGDVVRLVRFDDGLHVAVTLVFAVAGALLLATLRLPRAADAAPGGASVERAGRDLARAMRLARFCLYAGAVVLVVYVAAVSALFHWTLAFVDPTREALYEGVQALTRGAVTARSLLASALVVSVYAPAALMLRLEAGRLAARAVPEGSFPQREEWMKSHGLVSSDSLQHLKTLAAILAPVITGPIADLLQGALG